MQDSIVQHQAHTFGRCSPLLFEQLLLAGAVGLLRLLHHTPSPSHVHFLAMHLSSTLRQCTVTYDGVSDDLCAVAT